MKFIVIRTNLKDGIFAIEKTTGDNLNLPILKNVLIEAENSKLKLISTNLEIAVSCSVIGKVIENGKITVPIGALSNLVNNLQSERINIEKKGNAIEIKTDNYEAKLQGMSAEDFPLTPKVQNMREYLEMDGRALKDALGQVIVATQFSDLRPEFNSVLFHFSLESLKLTATDGFRLAEKTVGSSEFESKYEKDFRILIPLRTAQELMRIIKDDETVKIFHDQNQILFKTERIELISRLLEGNFPDYQAIIPKEFSAEAVVKRDEFINALKIVSVFGSRNNEVKLKLHDNNKIVEVTSADQALGENNFLLPAKTSGKIKEIIFNWRYLLDALKNIKTDDVFLGLNEETNPALIKSPTDGSYFYILKPIIGM